MLWPEERKYYEKAHRPCQKTRMKPKEIEFFMWRKQFSKKRYLWGILDWNLECKKMQLTKNLGLSQPYKVKKKNSQESPYLRFLPLGSWLVLLWWRGILVSLRQSFVCLKNSQIGCLTQDCWFLGLPHPISYGSILSGPAGTYLASS